jgi:serine/threonine protein kinase
LKIFWLSKSGGFGEACDGNKKKPRGYHGTVTYMAPEVRFPMKDERGRDRHYTDLVDVWSLGCVIMECATGRPPTRMSREDYEFYNKQGICHPYRLRNQRLYSNDLRSFLDLCLDLRAIKRPSSRDMKYHFLVAETYKRDPLIAREFVRIFSVHDEKGEEEVKDLEVGQIFPTTDRGTSGTSGIPICQQCEWDFPKKSIFF